MQPTAAYVKEIINKHCHILSININSTNNVKETFNKIQPIKAFLKNTSSKQLIRTNTIKIFKTFSHLYKSQPQIDGQYSTCFTRQILCCWQVLTNATFISIEPRNCFDILHQVTYLQIQLFNLSIFQYVWKPETQFHIRLNHHRKDIKTQIVIEAGKYFNNNKRTFSKHEKSIITELLPNRETIPTKKVKLRLENFWIKISKCWHHMAWTKFWILIIIMIMFNM